MVIHGTQVPDLPGDEGTELGGLARLAVQMKRSLDTVNETSHVFHLPALPPAPPSPFTNSTAHTTTHQSPVPPATPVQDEFADYQVDVEFNRNCGTVKRPLYLFLWFQIRNGYD